MKADSGMLRTDERNRTAADADRLQNRYREKTAQANSRTVPQLKEETRSCCQPLGDGIDRLWTYNDCSPGIRVAVTDAYGAIAIGRCFVMR